MPLKENHWSFQSNEFARENVVLDWTAKEIGVRPLSEFVGPRYVAASDGLHSVQALIREISAWPSDVDVKDVAGMLRDLQECERVLIAASERGARWRFVVTSQDDSGAGMISSE